MLRRAEIGSRVCIEINWLQTDGTEIPKGSCGEIIDIFPVINIPGDYKVKGYRIKFDDGRIDWGTGKFIRKEIKNENH